MSRLCPIRAVLLGFALNATMLPAAVDAYRPVDTQTSGRPLPAAEAIGRLRVPEGFKLTLAAAGRDRLRRPRPALGRGEFFLQRLRFHGRKTRPHRDLRRSRRRRGARWHSRGASRRLDSCPTSTTRCRPTAGKPIANSKFTFTTVISKSASRRIPRICRRAHRIISLLKLRPLGAHQRQSARCNRPGWSHRRPALPAASTTHSGWRRHANTPATKWARQ